MKFAGTQTDAAKPTRVDGYPCAGPITSPFGAYDIAAHMNGGHTGCDIGADLGTPIAAPAEGTVKDVFIDALRPSAWDQWKDVFGNSVILDHGAGQVPRYTLYGHMRDAPLVHEGEAVIAGEQLGVVGTTGESTGPHLHWGASLDGNPYLNIPSAYGGIAAGSLVDPLAYV